MVVVDVDHRDIEGYVDWKVKEKQKVAALAALVDHGRAEVLPAVRSIRRNGRHDARYAAT